MPILHRDFLNQIRENNVVKGVPFILTKVRIFVHLTLFFDYLSLLGPSTPLYPMLAIFGCHFISGAFASIIQGATGRSPVHKAP